MAPTLTPAQLLPWLSLGAAILAAGLWLGKLDQRVTTLEKTDTYLHGAITLPR